MFYPSVLQIAQSDYFIWSELSSSFYRSVTNKLKVPFTASEGRLHFRLQLQSYVASHPPGSTARFQVTSSWTLTSGSLVDQILTLEDVVCQLGKLRSGSMAASKHFCPRTVCGTHLTALHLDILTSKDTQETFLCVLTSAVPYPQGSLSPECMKETSEAQGMWLWSVWVSVDVWEEVKRGNIQLWEMGKCHHCTLFHEVRVILVSLEQIQECT